MKHKLRTWLLRVFFIVILGLLLWWAVRYAPLVEIWAAFRVLQLWQILIMLVVNIMIYILVTLRWWLIARADAKHIPYLPLLGVRVSVFGVSYFTLGPQVGENHCKYFSCSENTG
jgi:uncharacterized membrane protein YbhN (UPF0104 family)